MINYAFVNLSSRVSYINDANFAFRGTWSSGSTYAPPVDVVDYNNGKFIVLVSNTATPPLNSSKWSEMVQVGTVVPSTIDQIALDTANAASILALSASGTAQAAYTLVTTVENVADNAAKLALPDPPIGTVVRIVNEANRIERYVGNDPTLNSSWVVLGPQTYEVGVISRSGGFTVNGTAVVEGGVETSLGWYPEGAFYFLAEQPDYIIDFGTANREHLAIRGLNETALPVDYEIYPNGEQTLYMGGTQEFWLPPFIPQTRFVHLDISFGTVIPIPPTPAQVAAIAVSGSNIAVAGSNLAYAAYALASSGTQVFGASGPNHAKGAVPDPGASAGTLRYLREDAAWANPSVRAVTALIDAGTVTPNSDTTDIAYLASLSQTTFIANPLGTPWDSKGLVFRIKSAAPQLLSFGTLYRGGLSMALPAATTGNSKTDYFAFIFNNGDTRWDFTGSVLGF